MGIRGGFHQSRLDPRPHYCVRAFRQDGHAYKTMHIYWNTESSYYRKGVGQFGRRYGTTLDVSLECEDLGYVRFRSSNQRFCSLIFFPGEVQSDS